MNGLAGRLRREWRTIDAMISLYCSNRHGTAALLCPDCSAVHAYAEQRLVRCPFGDDKPTCANCTIHCYRAEMRERVREVMRFSGPRMLRRHPYLALMHLLVDGRRAAPALPARPA